MLWLSVCDSVQSSKPRLTVPCCSIVDVRSTTALEVPDKENTFLLQVNGTGVCCCCCSHHCPAGCAHPGPGPQLDGAARYVMETRDAVQMRAWLSDLRNSLCLR